MERECERKNPRLAVVIPVRNRRNLIVRCLDSVRRQNYDDMELIVVDNGSVDGTARRVREWIRQASAGSDGIKFQAKVVEEPAPGATRARNRGFSACTAPYVLFFDSDDEMQPGLVRSVMERFEENPELDMVCWRAEYNIGGKRQLLKTFGKDRMKSHIYHCVLSTQTYAVKSELLVKAGGWNDELLAWNDWELGVRLLVHKPNISLINRPLVKVYHQKDSITGENFHSKAGSWEASIAEVEKTLSLPGVDTTGKYRLMALYVRAILAAKYSREGRGDLAHAGLETALSSPKLNRMERILLRLLYLYTSKGGRGAYIFWK